MDATDTGPVCEISMEDSEIWKQCRDYQIDAIATFEELRGKRAGARIETEFASSAAST